MEVQNHTNHFDQERLVGRKRKDELKTQKCDTSLKVGPRGELINLQKKKSAWLLYGGTNIFSSFFIDEVW